MQDIKNIKPKYLTIDIFEAAAFLNIHKHYCFSNEAPERILTHLKAIYNQEGILDGS